MPPRRGGRDWPGWPSKIPKLEIDAQPLTTEDKLEEALQRLEITENRFTEKASQEVEKGTRAKNKWAAKQSLKRKNEQMIMLEGAKATTETEDAQRTGAAAMEASQNGKNIDDTDNFMYEIDEQNGATKRKQEAVSGPSGVAADFDEDELEAELEDLEGAELEEQLLPVATASAAPEHVIGGPPPAPPAPQGSD